MHDEAPVELLRPGWVRGPGTPGCKIRGPRSITVDYGTEFTSKALEECAWQRGVKLYFIRPGKPTDNGSIESFNGRFRDECLKVHQFEMFEDACDKCQDWRIDYNRNRPHISPGHRTPSEYIKTRQITWISEAAIF